MPERAEKLLSLARTESPREDKKKNMMSPRSKHKIVLQEPNIDKMAAVVAKNTIIEHGKQQRI